MALNQDDRMLTVSTPLGPSEFLLTGFRGTEFLSQPFSHSLELVTDRAAVVLPTDLIGKPVAWKVRYPEDSNRQFHGIVRKFQIGPVLPRGFRTYIVEVVPWLQLLAYRTDSRIFQEKTLDQILDAVFRLCGFSDFRIDLQNKRKRDYCVMYRETFLNFVSRLMEEDGAYYYFEYAASKHTLVVTDKPSSITDCTTQAEVEYRPDLANAPVVTEWNREYRFVPGRVTISDFHYLTPADIPTQNSPTVVTVTGLSSFEQFRHPERQGESGHNASWAAQLMQQEEVAYDTISGASQCSDFIPGKKFKLLVHPLDKTKKFAFTSVTHQGMHQEIPGVREGRGSYSNAFTAIPDSVNFRPPLQSRRPLAGAQTAIVVGPEDGKVNTDEYGRVKVQFHWNRGATDDEKHTCWTRVSELWAGPNWGSVFLPRVGHEVVVDFIHGDPDQPIVTGRVYNGTSKHPYTLPDLMTRSGIRTERDNELWFEDKPDNEDIFFHARKDFHRKVDNDDDLIVTNNQTRKIEKGNHTFEITEGTRTETIKGKDELTIQEGDKATTISKGNVTYTITEGTNTVSIKGNDSTTITDGNYSLAVSKGTFGIAVAKGDAKYATDAGSTTVEAGTAITLKVGGNKIEITTSGIKLTVGGSTIELASSAIDVKSTAVTIKGSGTAELSAGGNTTVKGAMVMIN